MTTAEVRYAVQPQSGIHDDTGLPTDAISLTQESDDGKESGKKSAAMRVSANDGGASGRSGASRGVASPAAQSRWTNFLMCSGYAVQIVGGEALHNTGWSVCGNEEWNAIRDLCEQHAPRG